jgi:hypothetical protein
MAVGEINTIRRCVAAYLPKRARALLGGAEPHLKLAVFLTRAVKLRYDSELVQAFCGGSM